MIIIKKARIELYDFNKEICLISAQMDEQDDETLFRLGKGIMCSNPNMCLRYPLPKGEAVYLWTD
jgi:hypothetical protein